MQTQHTPPRQATGSTSPGAPDRQTDRSTLAWCAPEIRQSCARVESMLRTALADPARRDALLTTARDSVHQVNGALTMLDIPGTVLLGAEVEGHLDRMLRHESALSDEIATLLTSALAALNDNLDEVLRGDRPQPLRLFPYLKPLLEARKADRVHPADLFFPEIVQWPGGEPGNAEPDDAQRHAIRVRFEQGLLGSLRDARDVGAQARMLSAVQELGASALVNRSQTFWAVVSVYFRALGAGQLTLDARGKRLLARINLQLRQTLKDGSPAADRLLRDTLFSIACGSPQASELSAVFDAFGLHGRVPPDFEQPRYSHLDRQAVTEARASLTILMKSWDAMLAHPGGIADHLGEFSAALAQIQQSVGRLNAPGLLELVNGWAAVVRQLNVDSGPVLDALGIEVATSLLFVEELFETGFTHFDDLSGRCRDLMRRLDASMQGLDVPDELPQWLRDLHASVQERLTRIAFIDELRALLNECEAALDQWHRKPDESLERLKPAVNGFAQIASVMRLLGHGQAGDASAWLSACARQLLDGARLDEDSVTNLATSVGSLGFFVDALAANPSDLDRYRFDADSGVFLRTAPGAVQPDGRVVGDGDHADQNDPALTPRTDQSAEQALVSRQAQLDEVLQRWALDGRDESIRLEAAELLQNICDSAQLVDAADLLANAQAAIALAGQDAVRGDGAQAARQIAIRLGRPAALCEPLAPEVPAASVAPATVEPVADESVDEELLEIFLTEATDVLESIAGHERGLADAPGNLATLTDLRRGFHTLKGSSRMVGLDAFGEAAWSLEQLLNQWLGDNRSVDAELLDLIADARVLFGDWVTALQSGPAHGQRPDPTLVVARAEALLANRCAPAVGSPATAPVPAQPALADAPVEALDAALVPLNDAPAESVIEPMVEPMFEPVTEFIATAGDETVRIGEREIKAQLFKIFCDEVLTLQGVLESDAQEWLGQPTRKANDAARRAMHSLRGSAGLVQAEPARTLAASLERFLSLQIASLRNTSADDVQEYHRLIGILSESLGEFTQCQVPATRDEAVAAADALHARWQPGGTEVTAPPAEVKPPDQAVTVLHADADQPKIKDDFDEELLPLFVTEAEEYLPEIDANLRAWLREPDNAQLQRLIMRQLHTVKGSARMAGAMVLGQRVHEMETRVEAAMALPTVPTSLIEQLMTEQDLVTEQFEYIRDPSLMPQIASVAAMHESSGQSLAAAATGKTAGKTPVEDKAGGAMAVPAAAAEEGADGSRQTQPLVRVRAEVLDKLVNEAGEITIARSRLDNSVGGLRQTMSELAENVNRLRTHLREIEMQSEMRIAASDGVRDTRSGEFDPLEFDRYTRFQELTRMLAESVNDVATVQVNATRAIDEAMADLGRQGHTLRQLQHNLLGIRMVQFGTISDRLYRIVRQVAKAQGKRVSLDIRGAAVQVDRGVLERMVAPLEHLLRNAISHGIEEPANRLAAGKAETGDIRIEVAQEGNEIMLALSDDGGGLDLVRIRERGIERGLITRDEAVTDELLADLIFMPGFTTVRTVDQISGRGVGMDVVRTEVGLLGGRVQINFAAGKGSRFTIHLPLTMAIEQVMMVSVGDLRYSVPAASVEQIMQLDPDSLGRVYENRAIQWQDESVPLYWLASLVDRADCKPVAQHHAPVMIVRSSGRRIAVHADAVSKAQEVVVKNVGPQVAKVAGVAGATVMGDGDVVLILNLGQLASRVSDQAQDEAMRAGMSGRLAAAPPTVMVVDDSVTVRKVTQRFLAREGFDVMLAKDGVDALRQLEERRPDVMLVDIEMPRMDGFDLTRAVRRDDRFKRIPIVMITSRTADKHRNFAMSLGVNDYLGKPYDETTLLGLVNTYAAGGSPS